MTAKPLPSNPLDLDELANVIRLSLHETIFSSGLRISPRRIEEISHSIARSYFRFHESPDHDSVRADGKELVNEGLGPRSFLAAVEAMRRVCASKSNAHQNWSETASLYAVTLTLAYIDSRECRLLQQQELTHQAFIRAQGRAKGPKE